MEFDDFDELDLESTGGRRRRSQDSDNLDEFDGLDEDRPLKGRRRPRGEPEVFCPSCGADIPAHAKRCPECGERLDYGSTCHYCGAAVSPNAHFCPNCGSKVS